MYTRLSFLLLFISFCISFTIYGQRRKLRFEQETFNAASFKLFPLQVKTSKNNTTSTPFRYVLLTDNRADKSKVGFVKAGQKIEDYPFVFSDSAATFLTKKLNKLISPDSTATDTLSIRLNNLWLYQTTELASMVKQALTNSENYFTNCYLQADLFRIKNNIPVYIGSTDSSISERGWIGNACNKTLKEALITALEIASQKFNAETLPANHLIYPVAGSYPIQQTMHPAKGIYLRYTDFLNNTPFPVDLTVEQKTFSRKLTSSGLSDSVIADCWGYCDETGSIFMNIENDFYKLNRSENTFDVLAPLLVEIRNTSLGIFLNFMANYYISKPYIDPFLLVQPNSRSVEILRPFQLDISTGRLR